MSTLRKSCALAGCVLTGLTLQAVAADTGMMGATTRPTTMPSQGSAMQGMDSAIDAVAMTATFTVQDVDKTNRTVSLRAPDGTMEKFKCGPEVRNFDQIQQGDQVRATVVDELAVGIRPGSQAAERGGEMVSLAPKGAKPGMVMIQTEQMTAKVLAVDPTKRMVSLEGPSGRDRTIKVSPKVDLNQIKKGDSVTVQVAQGMAITVQSPQESAEPSGATMSPPSTQQGMQPRD